MENKIGLFFLSNILLSCFTAQISGMKQTEAFFRFHKEKLTKTKTHIDTSLFDASEVSYDESNLLVGSQNGQKELDKIVKLPGQTDNVPFDQYGGYVVVDEKAGRALYYYFVEAQRSPDKLPLLLWLNGGPGCSSFGYGAMIELGPFRVHSDGETLYINNFAWNHAANVLFLESPAGVGFSYSNRTSEVKISGDNMTAIDNYVFLVNWLKRFPEYKNRDFYIAGESYAGHYAPQLAQIILHNNQKAKKTIINLKGIIIGNAAIHYETDRTGVIEYARTHALISDDIVNQIFKYCNFSSNAPTPTHKCDEAIHEYFNNIDVVDIFNIYAPLCSNHNLTDKPKKVSVFNVDPCSEDYIYAYLNRPEVQKALHANVTKLPYDWDFCSNVITDWIDSPRTVLNLLNEIMDTYKLRVWIYSGDVDGRIPVTSTQLSIDQMKLAVKTQWHPWYHSGQVGGYTTVYRYNFTFATVRGAGHQVPRYKSAEALALIMHFLKGTELPNSSHN